jgi:hypothetical protein
VRRGEEEKRRKGEKEKRRKGYAELSREPQSYAEVNVMLRCEA